MAQEVPDGVQGDVLGDEPRGVIMPQGVVAHFRDLCPAAEGVEEFIPVVVSGFCAGVGEDVGAGHVPALPGVKEGLPAPGAEGDPAGRAVAAFFLPGPEAYLALGVAIGLLPIHVFPGEIVDLPDPGAGVKEELEIGLIQGLGQEEDRGDLLRAGHELDGPGHREGFDSPARVAGELPVIHRQLKNRTQGPEVAGGVGIAQVPGQVHELMPHHLGADLREEEIPPGEEPAEHGQVVPKVPGGGVGLDLLQAAVHRLQKHHTGLQPF